MAKRRSVVLGLGALATGSGAILTSGAFDTDFAAPDADMRVIADAQLRVRSVRDSQGDPAVAANTAASDFTGRDGSLDSSDFYVDDTEDLSTDFDEFFSDHVEGLIESPGAPNAAALEINEDINSDLGLRTAFSNGITGGFDPIIEITNNDNVDYNIKINYAENDGDSDDIVGQNGYGSDVNTTTGEFTDSDNNNVSRETVQDIYQFHLTSTDIGGRNDSSSDRLLSPDPSVDGSGSNAADENNDSYSLSSGETVFVELQINTDEGHDGRNLIPEINSAAAGGDDVFAGNANLSLLNEIYVTANETS